MASARTERSERRADRWSGRTGFILATIGSAVGIGSIWKFPYEVGAGGGSAFVLFYLAGLALVVVPLMLAELAIGRRGRGDPVSSLARLAHEHAGNPRWSAIGTLGVLTGFLILSFYAVFGGWTIAFAVDTVRNGLPAVQPGAALARYEQFLARPAPMLGYHALFVAACAVAVARGVQGGIEAGAKVLMPVLGVLLVLLTAWSCATGDLARTVDFMFRLHWERLDWHHALDALGLGFFSIGVGLGLMITYAAYADATIDLQQVTIVSVVADTVISILAGFAVFPVVFAHGLDPAGGAGLVFVTLPLAFAGIPGGTVAAAAFFLLLCVAALASAISMLELVVAMLVIRRGWRRARATLAAALACFAAGVPSALSFNLLAGWHPLAAIGRFHEATFFDLLDELTSNVMLPMGGLGLAIFVGWKLPQSVLANELALGATGTRALAWTLRYVVPATIVLTTLGGFVG